MTDDELIRRFEGCTLPREQWDHRTHVKVAYLYLRDHSLDEAVDRMRTGIRAFNAAHGIPDGPSGGYHETMTLAFMRLIGTTMKAWGDDGPGRTADAFCDTHPELLIKQVLRLFYSPRRIRHPDAHARFLEPDLAPLPTIDGPT